MSHSLEFWQVDSFATEPFKGNPAAVFVLSDELDDTLMQNIAIEMNLSETAFILLRENEIPLLRWFTPMCEVDLCGHATLAASHIYLTSIYPNKNEVTFDTKFAGQLAVKKQDSGYVMNLPVRAGEKVEIADLPDYLFDALSPIKPIAAYKSRDLMLVYDEPETIRSINPNFSKLLDYKDWIIVTSKSDESQYDFISRFFCADDGIAEDPVTGSAHCTLAPYWANKLGKKKMVAYQASRRGGELKLELTDEHVLVTGNALTIINGTINIQ